MTTQPLIDPTTDPIAAEVDALPEFQQLFLDSILATLPINPDTGEPDPATVQLDATTLIIADNQGDDIEPDAPGTYHIHGGAGDDTIVDYVGVNDVISGGAGDDYLDAEGGPATLSGGAGDDALVGGDYNDKLSGGTGNDDITGQGGDDIIYGGAGDDTIDGGDGNDFIVGGTGNDLMYGGEGQDTFVFGKNDGNDTICDFQAGDMIQASTDSVIVNHGNDDFTMTTGNTTVDIQVLGVSAIELQDGHFIGIA